ncbi:MAG: hypothetical protein K2I90_07030 [Odoribacter sp.]|nr:hypothetical protein [Odoribacter sp.]
MRTILRILILIGMALTLDSCLLFYFVNLFKDLDDEEFVICSRIVINKTGQDVTLKVFSEYDTLSRNIMQDSICFLEEKYGIFVDFYPFEFLNATSDSVVVYSKSNEILRKWYKSEQAEEGVQFFKEDSWKKRAWQNGNDSCYEWTFELLPEDIQHSTQ